MERNVESHRGSFLPERSNIRLIWSSNAFTARGRPDDAPGRVDSRNLRWPLSVRCSVPSGVGKDKTPNADRVATDSPLQRPLELRPPNLDRRRYFGSIQRNGFAISFHFTHSLSLFYFPADSMSVAAATLMRDASSYGLYFWAYEAVKTLFSDSHSTLGLSSASPSVMFFAGVRPSEGSHSRAISERPSSGCGRRIELGFVLSCRHCENEHSGGRHCKAKIPDDALRCSGDLFSRRLACLYHWFEHDLRSWICRQWCSLRGL